MEVIFTPRAEEHLYQLHKLVLVRSGYPQRADGYIERIVEYCRDFSTLPQRGTLREDILPGLRTIGFERRITIAFTVTSDAVVIQGVYYAGRTIRLSS